MWNLNPFDPTLVIGERPARRSPPAPIIASNSTDAIEDAPVGSTLHVFDYLLHVTPRTIKPSQFQPLRHASDPLADALVDFLELRPGQDSLAALQVELGKGQAADASAVDFWAAVDCEPPANATALPPLRAAAGAATDAKTPSPRPATDFVPPLTGGNRHAPPSLSEGQAVFWRYSGPIFGALMHFSLAGGFSAPKLGAAMNETGYLTSEKREATYKRLLETTLMVLDCMSDMRVGEGRGWRSCVRVRLLHAMVRRRIRIGKGKLNIYDTEGMGIPINQADLLTVLGSFMIAPIWSMRRCHIHLSPAEAASYQAAWRHVGFYLGIEPDLLEEYYGHSFERAEANFAALAFDAFPQDTPEDPYATPTYRILSAVAERPPRGQPSKSAVTFTPAHSHISVLTSVLPFPPSLPAVGHHLELARLLLGPSLATHIAIPRAPSIHQQLSVLLETSLSWLVIHFGRHYRPGWEARRQHLFRHVIELLVVWQLGERRTTFAWRVEDRREDKFTSEEGEGPGMEMGPHVGVRVKGEWKWLMAEAGAVAVAGLVAVAGAAWWAVSRSS